MQKVIINTDIGGDFDDLLAMLLAINSPEIQVEGIITTKEDIRDKAKFARKILNLAGKQEIPVFYDGQLKKKKGNYISVYDYSFLSDKDLQEQDVEFGISDKGIDFIIDSIHKSPQEINLISLAPNTNLANALLKDPSIAPKINSIYLMGGVLYRNKYNLHKPEHNYVRDRKAFEYVTSQNIPISLLPRDITYDLFLNPAVIRSKANKSKLHDAVSGLADCFLSYTGRDSFRLCDPLTVGAFLFPDIFKGQEVRLTKERGKQGDILYCIPMEGGNITAFYDFDRKLFYERLIRLL